MKAAFKKYEFFLPFFPVMNANLEEINDRTELIYKLNKAQISYPPAESQNAVLKFYCINI